jgi:serine protease Do
MRVRTRSLAAASSFALALAAGVAFAAPAEVKDLEDAVIGAVAAVRPAVVHIGVANTTQVSWDPFGELFGHGYTTPRRSEGMGSGVIVSDDGYIITNHHVVGKADEIKVKLHDGRVLPARRIGTDQLTDVAVIKIGGAGHPYAKLADSDEVKVGQFVIAIGTPFGLDQTVTLGIISARGRRGIVGTGGSYEDFIQTDVAINPGNSGGPLVNLEGKVIGINSAIYSHSGGYQGIGFAIPSNLAKTIMDRLMKVGYVERAWLGVGLQDVTVDIAASVGLAKPEGAAVNQVFPGSPAAKAGLRLYDVIVSVAGRKVRNVGELRNRVAHTPVGEEIKITYVRDGRKHTARPKLAAHPGQSPVVPPAVEEEEEEATSTGSLGLRARPITGREAQALGYPDADGLLVLRVYPEGAAAEAGIEPGEVILEADRVPVSSEKDLERAKKKHEPGKSFLLLVRNRTGTRLVTVRF